MPSSARRGSFPPITRIALFDGSDIAFERGEKEPPLVTEGGVQAAAIDLDSFDQVADLGCFIAAPPEQHHWPVQHLGLVELLYSCNVASHP
jgi:hypothetical protein